VDATAGLIAIGCGEFGARAAAYLALRAAVLPFPVRVLTITGSAPTRAAGAELLHARAAGFWSELEAALRELPDAVVGLVAAAYEPAGSGSLVEGLRFMKSRQTRAAWLGLPLQSAPREDRARAYATLLELEALHDDRRLERCFLFHLREDRPEPAALVGDAMLLHSLRRPTGGRYAGFGAGLLRVPQIALAERLAPRLVQMVQERSASAKEPAMTVVGGGLKERMERHVRDLAAANVSQMPSLRDRWAQSGSLLRQLDASGGPETESLRRNLENAAREIRQHYDQGSWPGQVRQYWYTQRDQVERRLREELDPQTSYGSADSLLRELRPAMEHAFRLAESGLGAAEAGLLGRRRQLKTLEVDIQQRTAELLDAMARDRRSSAARRGALAEALRRYDEAYAFCAAEGHRVEQLKGLVAALRELLPAASEHLRSLGEREAAAAQAANPRAEALLLPHVLVPGLPPHLLDQALLPVVDVIIDREQSSPEPLAAQRPKALLLLAREELSRAIGGGTFGGWAFQTNPDERARWFASLQPALDWAGKVPEVICAVSPGFSSEYRQELARRLGAKVVEQASPWVRGEVFAYTETAEFVPAQLMLFSSLHQAYWEVPEKVRPNLHAFREPARGWAALERQAPRSRVDTANRQMVLQAAARVLIRAGLLGLIPPAADNSLAGHALRHLEADPEARQLLERQAATSMATLQPRQLAAYNALLLWFQRELGKVNLPVADRAALDGAVLAELRATLTQLTVMGDPAGWKERVLQMLATIGTDADDFSVAAGPWRCLVW